MEIRTSRVSDFILPILPYQSATYSKEDAKSNYYSFLYAHTNDFLFVGGFACQTLKKEITIGLSTKMALNWAKKAIV